MPTIISERFINYILSVTLIALSARAHFLETLTKQSKFDLRRPAMRFDHGLTADGGKELLKSQKFLDKLGFKGWSQNIFA
jgi:hypothetical protein